MSKISFTVNGIKCSVGSEISSDVMLLDYIRNYLELRGTKYMCREGGCGACIVSVVKSPGETPVAVNACLVSVTSCYNWEITTVEKVGNVKDGYNQIQSTLADTNGTQCGYCTPGWIMSMYSLLQSKKNLTMLEIEKSFGSNICRCTGYRPIMEAFKKFGKDATDSINLADIEDLQICKKTGSPCFGTCEEDEWCFIPKQYNGLSNILGLDLKDGRFWYRVSTIGDIFEVFNTKGTDSYMLVAGNTAKGAYPIPSYPTVLIDVNGISELKGWTLDQNLIIGAGTTLSEVLDIFQKVSLEENFSYLKSLYDHLQLVAHIPVRNIGTLAGNLMIKHSHNDFPSDVFLLLLTVDARLSIRDKNADTVVSMEDFLKTDMKGKVIVKALLPPLSSEYKIVTYKIMPRSQSAHAILNAGFLYQLSQSNNSVLKSRIFFGGLTTPYTRANQTENYLASKQLFTNETLQGALNVMNQEIVAVINPPEPSPEYRKQLALNLFYKGLLSLCPADKLQARYKSGATKIHEMRPVSQSRQIYDTNRLIWPLNQPLGKVEALRQCSAEVPYTEDLPSLPFEVFGAFVLSTVCKGTISNIDASEALKIPGVLNFYTAKDIPGVNSFIDIDQIIYKTHEEVLCSSSVKYYNQPIGIIVAETQHLAELASKKVNVTYTDVKIPVVEVKEAQKDQSRVSPFLTIPAIDRGFDMFKVIKGSTNINSQYHFSMETLVCVSKPSEDGIEVHAATQWMDNVQCVVARALNMDANSIEVYVRRLGGAFGLKVSRTSQVAVASSLVTKKLNRPCRFILPLTTNMRAIGKRFPCTNKFEVAVNRSGVIQYADYSLIEDNGYTINEALYLTTIDAYYNLYKKNRWTYRGSNVITDTPKHTWCRAPGTLECVAFAEFMMERIAYEISVDPIDVRLANLDVVSHGDMLDMYNTLKSQSDYVSRRTAVNNFNAQNRWKKRGLRFSFMRYPSTPIGLRLEVNLSVYRIDGTVVISHSGIEMGQGLNTKAVQIAAFLLKIPVDKIKIKGNNSIIGPNSLCSGGSVTSQCVGIGIQRCCDELLQRLAPIKLIKPFATWEELIKTAYTLDVDLQTQGYSKVTDLQIFNIYGICVSEVELDVLTGESEIVRVDLLEDAGRSINPQVDIGQVEGAFMMGVGYFTLEDIIYNNDTGELLTDRTWSYHVPQARDIPQDFRVYLKKNSFSNLSIFGSKGTGEPPICLSVSIPFALREAFTAARTDAGIPSTEWYSIDGPYTVEKVCMAAGNKIEDFKFY